MKTDLSPISSLKGGVYRKAMDVIVKKSKYNQTESHYQQI